MSRAFFRATFAIVCEKKSGDEYEPTALRGIISSVELYLC